MSHIMNSNENIINPTITKTSIESFVFFTFSSSLDEDCIINSVVDKAFFDATNQGAFNTLIHKDDKRKEILDQVKKSVKDLLYKEIIKYTEKKGESFNKWHSDTCKKIIEVYNKDFSDEFTYGNAQKMVNMALKYLYLLSGIANYGKINDKLQNILNAVKADSKYLHVPIDSYIIDEIWRESDENQRNTLPIKDPKHTNTSNNKYKRPSDYIEAWSQWSEDTYYKIRTLIDTILKDEAPLEWESKAWIKSAKQRRSNQ